jgi:arginine/lysine/ornithine decarboxylase
MTMPTIPHELSVENLTRVRAILANCIRSAEHQLQSVIALNTTYVGITAAADTLAAEIGHECKYIFAWTSEVTESPPEEVEKTTIWCKGR